MAEGSSSARAHDRAAQRGAALGRLDHQRQARAGPPAAAITAAAPELAERLVRQADRRRGADPGPRDHGLGDRLVERRAARRRAAPRRTARRAARGPRGWRRPHRSRRAASGPRRRAARCAAAASSEASTSRSSDLEAGAAQRLGHPAPGAQRDVALVREAAGQDQHLPSAGCAASSPGRSGRARCCSRGLQSSSCRVS